MTESGREELLLSQLTDIAQTNRELVAQLENLNAGILELALAAKVLLSLRKNELREQAVSFFVGKSGPKHRLIELYRSIGSGKTRKELIDSGFPKGTVLRYCAELGAETLLQIKRIQDNGEEVLGYTIVEDLTQLSHCLQELDQTD